MKKTQIGIGVVAGLAIAFSLLMTTNTTGEKQLYLINSVQTVDTGTHIKIFNSYGLIDNSGKIIVPPQYKNIAKFSDGLAGVIKKGGVGYINKKGVVVVHPIYDNGSEFIDGTAIVSSADKYNFINMNGQLLLDKYYDGLLQYEKGVAAAKENKKWGYIDKKGKPIIAMRYDGAESFSFNNLAVIKIGEKYGVINKAGEQIINTKYDAVNIFSNAIWVREGDFSAAKYGMYNTKGKKIVPCKYDWFYPLEKNLFKVKLKNKWGYIDKKGDVVIPPKYDEAWGFKDSLAPVKTQNKWGYIDKKGDVVIPPKYDEAEEFERGIAVIKLRGKYGIIDKAGKPVTEIKYNAIVNNLPFNKPYDVLWVNENNKWGLINKKGKMLIPPQYDDIWSGYFTVMKGHEFLNVHAIGFDRGMANVSINGKWGYIDGSGNWIIPPAFDLSSTFVDGLAFVMNINENRYGYINKSGKYVWSNTIYDNRVFTSLARKIQENFNRFLFD